jgi:hypothetical protein
MEKFRATSVLLMLLLIPSLLVGQGLVLGSISGAANDSSGAAIADAKITAKQEGTNREFTTTTSQAGLFRLSGLPVGNYSLTVEAPSFSTIKAQTVIVNSNRDTSMGTLVLKPTQEEITVTVEGAAPMIERSSSQVTNSFNARAAADLPLGNGGNFDRLALLIPGVASGGDNQFTNTNGADISVNGQRTRSNNFQIDGQANNDNSVAGPQFFVNNPDLIGEFQVVTNNFSAEYGRNMGSVINYVTKSGTNAFHGTVFEFYQGNFTDAKINEERSGVFGFCEPGQAVGTVTPYTGPSGCAAANTPRFVDNRFGGTLGGPIWKDKAWFFGSYVMQRIRQSQPPFNSTPSIVPTPTGLAALASALPGSPAVTALQAFGPYAITQGNPIPIGNPVVLNVSDGVTVVPVEFAGIQRSLPNLFNDEQWSIRGDWQLSNKDRLFGRYLREETANTNASGLARGAVGAVVDVPSVTQQVGIDYSRSWTSNLVMQLRVGYSRADIGFDGGPIGCSAEVATLQDCYSSIQFAGANSLNANFGLANNFPQGRLVNNTQYQGNNTWVVGRHTLKFGGEYDRQRSPNVFLPNINGTFTFRGAGANSSCGTFAGISTLAPLGSSLADAQAAATACGFSNFLQNTPGQFTITDGNPRVEFKEQDMGFYFQDDWRIKDNLTLNLGLRWEWNEQAINLLHEMTVAQQTGSSPFWDTTLPLDRTTVPSVPEDRNNFGPNIGVAWIPKIWPGLFGDGKTVFRGGYRIAYDPAFYNMFLNVLSAAPVVNAGAINGLGVAPGLPTSEPPTGNSLRAAGVLSLIPVGTDPGLRAQTQVSQDFHNPYSQQWSFGLQREINRSIAYEVRYVGNHTVGNFQSINGNPRIDLLAAEFPNLLPAGTSPCATVGAPGVGRVDCDRSLVRVRSNTSFSIYHGLQQELRVQDWHSFSGGLSHTWSRAIDNVSEIFATIAGGNTNSFAANPFDPNVNERGVGGNSYPHVVTFFWLYDLPIYKDQQGVLGKMLGGWNFNGTFRYTSGQPYTPIQFNGSNSVCDAGFSTQFNSSLETCRPFLSNPNAAADTVGLCTDRTLADCGLVDFYTGTATTADAVHIIYNEDEAAHFFGTPFGTLSRNTLRGQTFNQWNMALFKNTKITERVNFQLQAVLQNVFNRQFRGSPDPLVEDGNLANNGSYGNNFFSVATITPQSTRRRLQLGAKIIF